MTQKRYLAEPQNMRGQATVEAVIPAERPIVRLDRTWFHPQGGGQKADRGRLGSSEVLHVAHHAEKVDHVVASAEGIVAGMTVDLEIDEAWRRLNAAYHTAGHLIACAVEAMQPRLKAVSGHQWPGEARVEFEGDFAGCADLSMEAVNARLARDLADGLHVAVLGDPYARRSIAIGSYPPIPCGGTHVSGLADITCVRVLAMKVKGRRLRLSYEADPAAAG